MRRACRPTRSASCASTPTSRASRSGARSRRACGQRGCCDAPWIQAQLRQLLAQRGHAWLLQGPSGLGQYSLASALAQAWLCDRPTPDGACGQCDSCHQVEVRAHTDLAVLMPETVMHGTGLAAVEKAQADIDDKKRKPSKEIRVDAMRDALEFAQRTSGRGRGKVVLVYPAERMNHHGQRAAEDAGGAAGRHALRAGDRGRPPVAADDPQPLPGPHADLADGRRSEAWLQERAFRPPRPPACCAPPAAGRKTRCACTRPAWTPRPGRAGPRRGPRRRSALATGARRAGRRIAAEAVPRPAGGASRRRRASSTRRDLPPGRSGRPGRLVA
jgi:hypothetical protein